MTDKRKLATKARRIKMILLDVDGVMTDGGLYYSADGEAIKRFNAHDGHGIVLAREHGLKIGIISGRKSTIVDARARALKIEEVYQNIADKEEVLRDIQRRNGMDDENFAYIGDDIFDIPLLQSVGLSAAPKNALAEVKNKVDYVTKAGGGDGAVREFIDLILRYQK